MPTKILHYYLYIYDICLQKFYTTTCIYMPTEILHYSMYLNAYTT